MTVWACFRACMLSVVDETLTYNKMYRGINPKGLSTRIEHITLIGINSANVQIQISHPGQGEGGQPFCVPPDQI